MPRNKSEALPTCRPAHAYADCIEKWLADGRQWHVHDRWRALPISLRDTLLEVFYADYANRDTGPLGGSEHRIRLWRKYSLDYIRSTYAT